MRETYLYYFTENCGSLKGVGKVCHAPRMVPDTFPYLGRRGSPDLLSLLVDRWFPKGGPLIMTRFIGCIVALMLFNVADVQAQGYIDGLMNRATESAKRKAQDRVNQNIDQSIDKAIRKTEDTVKCVATDRECLRQAKEEGRQVEMVEKPATNDTMKCLITDTGCMKQAKAQRKKVEIVEEHQLDTLRCSTTDTDCLARAKAKGKKVDIID
jgi:hypothetical protein